MSIKNIKLNRKKKAKWVLLLSFIMVFGVLTFFYPRNLDKINQIEHLSEKDSVEKNSHKKTKVVRSKSGDQFKKNKKPKKRYSQTQVIHLLKDKLWKQARFEIKKKGHCPNVSKLKVQSRSVASAAKFIEFKSSNALVVNKGKYLSNFIFDEDEQMIYLDVGDNLRESVFSLSGQLEFTKNGFKIIHQAKVDDFDCSPKKFQFSEEYSFIY